MTQYIDKSALVAYIEKTEEISKDAADKAIDTYFKIHFDGWVTACRSILSFIDTLEVKDVDLENEIKEVQRHYKTIEEYEGYPTHIYATGIELIAKHFFELGLNAQKG